MAHFVPMPPPENYHIPNMTLFSISSSDGVGQVLVWGADIPGAKWRIATENTQHQVISEEKPSPYPGLKLFELRGVREGFMLALYIDQGDGWKRYSDYLLVLKNIADNYATALRNNTLPKSKHHKRILYYPFGSRHACVPIGETEWMDKLDGALDIIKTNPVGKVVLESITEDIVIYPYLPCKKNANSFVQINPRQWEGDFRPGAGLDEVLLHELIHRIEQGSGMYENRWGFVFDGEDFLTVNATNVYSCMRGRALRKDHYEFLFLPSEHWQNPDIHWRQQKPNYILAKKSAPALVEKLITIQGYWNPFQNLKNPN
jgi:hypothetical protein